MDISIVVLAAGQGTRMKSSLPKVLHPIGGKPMLAHVLDTAKALNPRQIIVVYGQQGLQVKAAIDDDSLTWVEQPRQQGTGDAVAKALPHIPETHQVLVLYGDVPLITPESLQQFLNHVPNQSLGLLTLLTDDPTGLGRIVRDNGIVVRIVEERDANAQERAIKEINTGICLANAKHLHAWLPQLKNQNNQQEYYLTDIVQMAVNENIPVTTAAPNALQEVLGINDKIQLAQLERLYQKRIAEQLLKQGITLADPNRFDVRGTLKAEADVFIDVNVIFEGNNILHQKCHIGPNCVLINCEIGESATILANSHLDGAKVGSHVSVGPFARLRPGTVLAPKSRIGNFVEVKNATVGEGSKINHLSYVGDAVIGKDVNIGAGTITCNYDGVNKHQTIIEDGVHIGSDTQLIAPVRVGKGATIAAGSTVKKNAPSEELTLTHRLEQRSQPWQRKTKPEHSSKSE